MQTEWHGSDYGGFSIVQDSLSRDSKVLSCGIGEDASFDLSLLSTYSCNITAVDPTPRALEYAKTVLSPYGIRMLPFALSAHDGEASFYAPTNPSHVSGGIRPGRHLSGKSVSVLCRRLGSILAMCDWDRLDLLKMDIEGAEYDVLQDFLNTSQYVPPAQIAIEFHHFMPEFGLQATRDIC